MIWFGILREFWNQSVVSQKLSLVNLLVKLNYNFLCDLSRSRYLAIYQNEPLKMYFYQYEGILAALDSKTFNRPLKIVNLAKNRKFLVIFVTALPDRQTKTSYATTKFFETRFGSF